ncbi:MAG TPA: hypothetical protein VED59_05780 [Acidimicrobiales bacterium]|nr:hypothetical protein [Acidimicrobiales bacterium]
MTSQAAAAGALPRLLAIMGSGETTPTMVKTHRQIFERLGPPPVPGVILDTPYGFQVNAPDISARTAAYFRDSVGRPVSVASLARTEGADLVEVEAALASVAEARWIFAGPGSPTYALRQWRGTALPGLLAEKLVHGGCLVFASAAALTLGRWSVPVYEIYKVGADPDWAEGLDLLSPFGLVTAVIPHFDNAEGGTHDTRYCYLGEARLCKLEARLPPEGWVLGVDEHTACVLNLEDGTATVSGLGSVTVRRQGVSSVIPSGKTISIEELAGLALNHAEGGAGLAGSGVGNDRLAVGGGATEVAVATDFGTRAVAGSSPGAGHHGVSPFMTEVRRLESAFDHSIGNHDATGATAAVLELEATLHDWSADTFQSDELDRGRAALRRMLVRLGQAAGPGLRDPSELFAPWVEALLAERAAARDGQRFLDADRVRDRLLSLGVEVRDTPEGTRWLLPVADQH